MEKLILTGQEYQTLMLEKGKSLADQLFEFKSGYELRYNKVACHFQQVINNGDNTLTLIINKYSYN